MSDLLLTTCVCYRGSLATASDSFGRVLLIDIVSMTVVRIWKSYRDAQFGWVMCNTQSAGAQPQHNSTDQPMSNQAHAGKRRRSDQGAQGSIQVQARQQQSDSLHLVLYAPRRRALELWQMRDGARVATVQTAGACKLLQKTLPFGLKSGSSVSDTCSHLAAVGQCLIVDIVTGHTMDVLAALHPQTSARTHESA